MLLDAALHGPVPAPFVALTLNVYEVQAVNPDTVTGEEADVPVMHPGVEVAVYVVIAALPVSAGAVNVIDALSPEAVAVPIVGAPGLTGHAPIFLAAAICCSVQTPLATVAVGAVGFLVIIPPGY